jgi:hypothetical protein
METIRATPRYGRAIAAIRDLLARLRIESMFAGNVARAAWLGEEVTHGSIDVIALMKPEQKNQVAMMASNRGFRVDREQIEQSEELDLVPLNFIDDDGEVRVHVLVASNALYGTMVAAGRPAMIGDVEVKIPTAEDMALLLAMSEDDVALRRITSSSDFDRIAYNRKLVSIGLKEHVV